MTQSIGKVIQGLREARGWSQTELSRQADLSTSAISQFENGQRNPSTDALRKIAQVFGVPIDYFFGTASPDEPVKQLPEFQTMYRKLNGLPEQERERAVKYLKGLLDVHHPDSKEEP